MDWGQLLRPLKILRLLRLGRVYRKLDHYLEFGGAVLLLLIVLYCLIAHWMACIWYAIGCGDLLTRNLTFGWMTGLANLTNAPLQRVDGELADSNMVMSYLTALYYSLTCITSVGFGNVSANTELEKLFTITLMFLGGNSIFICLRFSHIMDLEINIHMYTRTI